VSHERAQWKTLSSIKLNSIQQAGRISLKENTLKIGDFAKTAESVLGTLDRFSISCLFAVTYKIDHLSKQQVIASDPPTTIDARDFAYGKL
jgi:hypothetical protein